MLNNFFNEKKIVYLILKKKFIWSSLRSIRRQTSSNVVFNVTCVVFEFLNFNHFKVYKFVFVDCEYKKNSIYNYLNSWPNRLGSCSSVRCRSMRHVFVILKTLEVLTGRSTGRRAVDTLQSRECRCIAWLVLCEFPINGRNQISELTSFILSYNLVALVCTWIRKWAEMLYCLRSSVAENEYRLSGPLDFKRLPRVVLSSRVLAPL
jgi:hypothetical protein